MIVPTIIQHLIHHRQEIRCRASFVIKRHSKLVNKLGFILDLYQLSLTHQHNRELFDSLVLSYSHDYHSFPCEMHSFRHLVSWISVIFNQRSYHKESGTRYLELFSYLIRKANLLPLLQESQILTSSMQHDLNNQTIYFLSCFLSLTKHCISKYHHDYLHYLIDIGLLKYFNAAIIITTRDTMLSHESRSMKLLYNKIIRNLQRLIKSNFQYKTVILQMNFPSDIKTILMISIDEMT